MKVLIDHYHNLIHEEPLTIAIGNFDGVHVGHQQLIQEVMRYDDTKSAILTFHPHPLKVLRDVEFQEIMILSEKSYYLNETGLDYMFVARFDKDFYTLDVDGFITFLKQIGVKRVIVGRDFRFAYHAKGSVEDLEKHFIVKVMPDYKKDSIRVSTTYIKDLIYASKLDEAKLLLGRDYQLTAKVIKGSQIGHTLGFPTANLAYGHYVLPRNGVYYVKVKYKDTLYKGALNIGYNPSINYSTKKRVEVHLLDFSGNLYGEELTIYFQKFIRPELKFHSKEALIEQLNEDIDNIRRQPF